MRHLARQTQRKAIQPLSQRPRPIRRTIPKNKTTRSGNSRHVHRSAPCNIDDGKISRNIDDGRRNTRPDLKCGNINAANTRSRRAGTVVLKRPRRHQRTDGVDFVKPDRLNRERHVARKPIRRAQRKQCVISERAFVRRNAGKRQVDKGVQRISNNRCERRLNQRPRCRQPQHGRNGLLIVSFHRPLTAPSRCTDSARHRNLRKKMNQPGHTWNDPSEGCGSPAGERDQKKNRTMRDRPRLTRPLRHHEADRRRPRAFFALPVGPPTPQCTNLPNVTGAKRK